MLPKTVWMARYLQQEVRVAGYQEVTEPAMEIIMEEKAVRSPHMELE